jgi:hypothetical protein
MIKIGGPVALQFWPEICFSSQVMWLCAPLWLSSAMIKREATSAWFGLSFSTVVAKSEWPTAHRCGMHLKIFGIMFFNSWSVSSHGHCSNCSEAVAAMRNMYIYIIIYKYIHHIYIYVGIRYTEVCQSNRLSNVLIQFARSATLFELESHLESVLRHPIQTSPSYWGCHGI